MQRIDTVNARSNINGSGKKGFHDNADLNGQDATYLSPQWLNALQEELCNVIEMNGLTLNQNSRQQLYEVIATNETVMALAEAVENRVHALEIVSATKAALDQAVSYLLSNINQHKNLANPHPQYLLATTFGVHLQMDASLTTPVEDTHRVFGWNGENGDGNMVDTSIRWWNSFDQTTTFKPYRAYGKFLLNLDFQPQGDGEIWVSTFTESGTLISSVKVQEIHDTHEWHDHTKYVFELPKNGYAEIRYWMSVWNRNYGVVRGSIYVDDRVKRFMPVGYTSIVDSANFNQDSTQTSNTDYSVFPAFEWFYYNTTANEYLQLSSVSTLETPVNKVPHFHRNNLASNTDFWVIVEVGKQTISNDYVAVEQQLLRAGSDEHGITITQIPFSMRNIDTQNNETVVYKVVYYSTQPTASLGTIPAGYLGDEHIIYFRV
ncbi:MAG: hypothetical protein RIQ74_2479 [Pseudomonadota bacterium]|jgi:hypothetical protein